MMEDMREEIAASEPEKKWYQDVTLEDAEIFILSNMKSAVRSVIAIGYYLKCIRDGKLYQEAGYENIWEYARDKYGFSKSTASRYMARNDKFSVDGNSPNLAEKYRGFSKAQLQEMLSLDDEELFQVTPDMTVRQIREMRKPAKEIPYYEIPGQTSFTFSASEILEISGGDMDDARQPDIAVGQQEGAAYTVNPGDFFPETEPVATSQQPVEESGKEPEDSLTEELSAYGTPRRIYPPDSLIATDGCGGGHDCFFCAMDCNIRNADRYCREAPMGNPFPCEHIVLGLQTLRDEIGDGCQFVNHDLAFHRAGDGEPDPCCKECKEPCEYICERAMKAKDIAEMQQEREDAAKTQQNEEECCNNSSESEVIVGDAENETDVADKSLSDLDLLKDMLERQNRLLGQFLQSGVDENDEHIRKQKLLVAAIASMVCDLDEIETKKQLEADSWQPELPKFKNNDQRKEWLRNYRDWGLWYEDKNIGARYYKYDFDNGASLIAEEYEECIPVGQDYTLSFLHLVGGPEPPKHPVYGFGKWNRNETYNRYPNSETELVEFLKAVQKEK